MQSADALSPKSRGTMVPVQGCLLSAHKKKGLLRLYLSVRSGFLPMSVRMPSMCAQGITLEDECKYLTEATAHLTVRQ